jgi:hypothetical protein
MFEAERDEGGIFSLISTSESTPRRSEHLTGELEGLDKHSTPDGAKETQAYTQGQSLPNPAFSSSSFQKSGQGPSTDKILTPNLDLSSLNAYRPSFYGISIPIFNLNNLAYTKLIVHALKYPLMTVSGLLLGQQSALDAPIDIIDAVPLQHYCSNLGEADIRTMDDGLGIVRSSFPRLLSSVALD